MKISVFWFRRDLRIHDNAGLYHALKNNKAVLPLFIFDKDILDELPPEDARVTFIHDSLASIHRDLQQFQSGIKVYYGHVSDVWENILSEFEVLNVYTNRDYEPSAIARDEKVESLLKSHNISLHSYKDQVIFEGNEVLKENGEPYTVFTPYKRKWLEKLSTKSDGFYHRTYNTEKYVNNLLKLELGEIMTLNQMGFKRSIQVFPSKTVSQKKIKDYDKNRDYPAIDGTSKLGIHFRFGTISIRQKLRTALSLNETFVSELIWRDFYSMIIYHFPSVEKNAFKPAYDRINWRNNETEFKAWCEGNTGYPLVDAGMRELNQTGYMHNRVRMVVASFLTKHLLIDWRWGEAYFAEKLLDFDLASNNGGWQWAAGCGTDAAPYFRIFSPSAQQEKFDSKGLYIKKWVPEYGETSYPPPIVDHGFARQRCLASYKDALQ